MYVYWFSISAVDDCRAAFNDLVLLLITC
jgi:hypothetical protein